MKEIKLTKNKVALVDDEDFENTNQYKWFALKGNSTFYAGRCIVNENGKNETILLHQFVMNQKIIDHIDHNGLNCQKYNLRKCTQQQNCMNKRPIKNTSSKFKGVSKHHKSDKWVSQIRFNYKVIYIGLFKNEIDAAKAYDKKAIELFGEFAWLNFKKAPTFAGALT